MQEQSVWIVVTQHSTDKQYLGQLTVTGEGVKTAEGALEECKRVLDASIDIGGVVKLSPCYRFIDTLTQQPTPQGMALGRNLMALPMGAELDTDRSCLNLTINSYQLITGMAAGDFAEYMKLVSNAKAMADSHRAERSGISIPGRDPNQRVQ